MSNGVDELRTRVLAGLFDSTLEQMADRLVRWTCPATADEQTIAYDKIMAGDIMFSTPALLNAGKDHAVLHACFCVPLEDDLDVLLKRMGTCARIAAEASGIGIDFSVVRAKNAALSSGGFASGPLAFAALFEALSGVIRSGHGRTRAPAFLAYIDVTHPDAMTFICAKQSGSVMQSCNISIRIPTLEVANRLIGGSLKVPDGGTHTYGALWDAITECAHATGDPGLIFGWRADLRNTAPFIDKRMSFNACAEVAIPAGQIGAVCNLGHVNLANHVDHSTGLDIAKLTSSVEVLVTYLDRFTDLAWYPDEGFKEAALLTRPIGVGVTGTAGALVKMGLEYGTDEAGEWLNDVLLQVWGFAVQKSANLAKDFGMAKGLLDEIGLKPGTTTTHPVFDITQSSFWRVWEPRLINSGLDGLVSKHGVRNLFHTCVAPCGTSSILAGQPVATGIEPFFRLVYDRKAIGESTEVVDPTFYEVLERYAVGPTVVQEMILKVKAFDGSVLKVLDAQPEWCRNAFDDGVKVLGLFVTATDLDWDAHLLMLDAAAHAVSMNVSKTVNLDNKATVSDVSDCFRSAIQARTNILSVAVYRDGSHKDQPLKATVKVKADDGDHQDVQDKTEWPIKAVVFSVETPQGGIYVHVSPPGPGAQQVFVTADKPGSDTMAWSCALGRVMSVALQHGVSPESLCTTLAGITAGTPVLSRIATDDVRPSRIHSAPDAVALCLAHVIRSEDLKGRTCDVCGAVGHVVALGGCEICLSCGVQVC